MEPMPDVVQNIGVEGKQKEGQQEGVDDFFLVVDIPVHVIQRDKQEYSNTAVKVRPVVQTGLHIDDDQVAREHLQDGEIIGDAARESRVGAGSAHEGIGGRDDKHAGKRPGKQREEAEVEQFKQDLLKTCFRQADHAADEIEHQENAEHDADVVIAQDRKA